MLRLFLFGLFAAGAFGSLFFLGYAIRVVIRDYGLGMGAIATFSVVCACLALGFLHDTRPHREP